MLTDFGFNWGDIEVQRTAWLPNGSRVLTVKTGRRTMTLYVSPTGLIRVFTEPHDEWRPVGRKERHGRSKVR